MNITKLNKMKQQGEKFSVVAAYDACWSRLINEAGIEVILVGDSLGMVVQGQSSTIPVTMSDMLYHTYCVCRANSTSLVIADMPFASYPNPDQASNNAAQLMQAGAHMVKLEGGEWLADIIRHLTQQGISVCAHLGLTPQSVNTLGGYRVQGRDDDSAEKIIEDAKTVQQAGAALLVLECVPQKLAKKISQLLTIPVIGIGAGPDTDAQVLVLHDMLGIAEHSPKFSKDFLAETNSIQDALKLYQQSVKNGAFPAAEHCFD